GDDGVGPDPAPAADGVRDPGGGPLPPLHGGAERRARPGARGLADRADRGASGGAARAGGAAGGGGRGALPARALRRAGAAARGGAPPLLWRDGPLGARDPITGTARQRGSRALRGRLRKPAVFVTPDMREAGLGGDRIALMANGALVGVGPPASLQASSH